MRPVETCVEEATDGSPHDPRGTLEGYRQAHGLARHALGRFVARGPPSAHQHAPSHVAAARETVNPAHGEGPFLCSVLERTQELVDAGNPPLVAHQPRGRN